MPSMLEQNAIQHVLDCYDGDIDCIIHDEECVGAAGMVEAGCFLCYYSDIREWWESAGGWYVEIDEKLWQWYIAIVSDAVETIIHNRWRYEDDE